MRETKFIEQNKEKWRNFEKILNGQAKDAEKLNDLFIQITDDLSYSRTFYSNRSVRVYLNSIAQRVFFRIYKARNAPFDKMINYWTDELPQLVHESRSAFRLSFIVFTLAFAIGVLSSLMDPEFLTVILGEDYVNMTLENIESGDPMAVYKQKGAFGMTFGITFNNLYVAFLTFLLGIFFGAGAVLIILGNGIMVGAFQYFFIERGLFVESFLTIWTHGTLEISAIIIAGAAGITMGRGLVFPGTLTRLQAFQLSARRGLKIMVGITPIIILAGIIEGYLTRFTETPDIIRASFILLCLSFVLFYFVWYPSYKARVGFNSLSQKSQLPPTRDPNLSIDKIKSSGDIFTDIFVVFRKKYKNLFLLALVSTIFYLLCVFLSTNNQPSNIFYFPNYDFGTIGVLERFFINEAVPFIFLISILTFTGLTLLGQHYILKTVNAKERLSWRKGLFNAVKILIGITLLHLILLTSDWYTIFLFVFLFPLPILYNYITQAENKGTIASIGRVFFLLSKNYGRVLGLFLILLIVSLFFFLIVDSALIRFFFDYIGWVIYFDQDTMDQISIVLFASISVFALHLLYLFVITGIGIQYYTLKEIKEANYLIEKIKGIGESKKIQGLEKE